jgi:predicted nucleotidyltransferase
MGCAAVCRRPWFLKPSDALHGADTEHSNLDILIDPTPETTLFDIGAIRHELCKLPGVPVDELPRPAL